MPLLLNNHLFRAQKAYSLLASINKAKLEGVKPVHRFISLSLLVSLISLSGCTDRVALSEKRMADIRASHAQHIEQIPSPRLVEDYIYSATNTRSPFRPPSLLNRQHQVASTEVAPDNNRVKMPLEGYELTTLIYRGIIVLPEGRQLGLIQRPDGIVDSVKVGGYMGMNDGRIVEITPTQINLIEIIPDSRAGFMEKPASVVSPI